MCTNATRRPIDIVDGSFIDWVQRNVLNEQHVNEMLCQVKERIRERAKGSADEANRLSKEAKKLNGEILRLTEALAQVDDTSPGAVVEAISLRERRLSTLQGRIKALRTAPSALDMELARLDRTARTRLEQLSSTLTRNPSEARDVVRALVAGHLTATPVETPEGNRFRLEGVTAFGSLFYNAPTFASPPGLETLRSNIDFGMIGKTGWHNPEFELYDR